MFSLLVPSLDFIPDFNSMVDVMQLGLVEDKTLRFKSKKKKSSNTASGNTSQSNAMASSRKGRRKSISNA